jgi:hypothetical protein
VLAIQALMF